LGFRREGEEKDDVDTLGLMLGFRREVEVKNGVDALGFGVQKRNATTKCTFDCD
jgi:hypothetical protein